MRSSASQIFGPPSLGKPNPPTLLETRVWFFHWIGCGLLILSSAGVIQAQDLTSKVTSHMPTGTVGLVSLWPAELAQKESMKFAPLEVFSAVGLEQVGIDPLKVQRLDVMIGIPGPRGPEFGAMVQLPEAIEIAQLNPDMFSQAEALVDKDYEYYELATPEELHLHQLDESTLLFGTPNFVKQMSRGSRAGNVPLATLASNIQSSQDAMLLVDLGTLRPMLQGFVEGPGQQMGPQVAQNIGTLIENSEFLAVRLLLEQREKLQLVLLATDDAGATNAEESLNSLMDFATQMSVAQFKSQVPDNSASGRAMHAYIDRVAGEIQSMVKPKRQGQRLIVELENIQGTASVGVMTGLLLPAIQASRFASRSVVNMNNMKQIGLALHNFESAYRSLPATAGLDDNGKPMISWRVAILPFIEEAELYQRFRLDEPWDSEHNLALLEEMPDVFKHPTRKTKPGYTVYQVPVGEETLLRLDEPTRFAQITDGTSNTLMLVTVEEEKAVPWTAPEDYQVDLDNPLLNLFKDGVTAVLMGDGSVRELNDTIDPKILRALYTRAGGEVVNFRDLGR